MKKIKLLGLLCGLSSSLVFADSFKLGYINVERLMAEATPAKTIKAAVEAKFAPQQAELKQQNQNLQSEEQALRKLQDKAPSYEQLSKADQKNYSQMANKFKQDTAQFQQQYGQYQQQLSMVERYASEAFLKQSNQALKEISSSQNFDLVVTSQQMVYAKAKYDLTDQLLAKINKINVDSIVQQIKSTPAVNQQTLPKASN